MAEEDNTPPQAAVPLDPFRVIMQRIASNDFWAIRGLAVQAYADLEQSMCSLFAFTGDIKGDVAAVIFFKITSAESIKWIIEKLFKIKFGQEYNIFRNSLLSHFKLISRERNEIVHWNTINRITNDENGKQIDNISLIVPRFYAITLTPEERDKEFVKEFRKKCHFFVTIIESFLAFQHKDFPATQQLTDEQRRTWNDIFHAEISYPPPEAHPLYQKP